MPSPPATTTGGSGGRRDVDREVTEAQSLLRREVAEAQSLLGRALDDLKRASTYQQLGWGAITGLLTGYLGVKVGRLAATTLGGSFLVLQVARHKGYINGNWEKIDSDIREISSNLLDDVNSAAPGMASEVKKFTRDNKYVAAGFAGGLLIGVSFS